MEATYSCNIPISLLPQQLSIFLVNHSHLLNMPQLLLTETLLPSSYIPSFLYTTLWQNSWKYFSTLIVSTISPSNHPSPFHFTPPLHRNCSPRLPMTSTFPMVKIHSQSAYYWSLISIWPHWPFLLATFCTYLLCTLSWISSISEATSSESPWQHLAPNG